MATYVTVRTVTNRVVVRSPGGASGGGGGGGVSDHDGLGASSLVWTSSAHTGTASRLAGFSGSGAAAYYAIGTDVQAYDATLASLAALGTAADRYAYTTGIDTWAEGTITAAGRALLDDADASAQRTTLGLVIGTDVQAYDAELAAIAGLTSAADRLPYFTGSGTAALATFTAQARSLLALTDVVSWQADLGLVIGLDVQAYDTDLEAIALNSSNGIYVRTGAGSLSARTITGTSPITVTNGDGVSGNPTIAISSASTSSAGSVQLATDGEESADVVQGTDTRLHASVLVWLGW